MRIADICAGIGMLGHAFDAVGGEVVIASERCPKARHTYERNWGVPERGFNEDMHSLAAADLRGVDGLVAGLPCQPFSMVGVRRGEKDERFLFHAFLSLVDAVRPQFALIENVPGMATIEGGRILRAITGAFGYAGYSVSVMFRDARPWLPQYRERLFILAALDKRVRLHKGMLSYPDAPLTVRDVLEPDWLAEDCVLSGKRKAGSERRIAAHNGKFIREDTADSPYLHTPLCSYRNQNGSLIRMHDGRLRMMTKYELAHLMGFPPFILPHNRYTAYIQIGNSVCWPVAQAIAQAIARQL